MPVFDKPEWIRQGPSNSGILGIDIDCSGQRLATAGADSTVRVWSMAPLRSEAAELDAAVQRQLAVLSDACSSVNCVRFAPSGRMLACGTDNADVLLYELREGRGTATFGSSEGPNVENWRLKLRMRGHDTNVSDVAWSPDSSRLASSSVDNRVRVWDVATGGCLRVLEGHVGHVKGVAWDPLDAYLASQSDREAIVWRLEDGVAVARVEAPFRAAPTVSFALRLGWSPDGQKLALVNGFEAGQHTVPLLQRNTWAPGEYTLCGHRGPVSVVRYNPRLFHPPPPRKAQDHNAPPAAAAAADDDVVAPVVAVGSNDTRYSVWNPGLSEPVCVVKSCFKAMVTDMAWTPDGVTLVAASCDGTVTVAAFPPGELGKPATEAEFAEVMAQLYGDPAVRQRGQRGELAAAPELLALEAAATAEARRQQRLDDRLAGAGASAEGPAPVAAAGAAAAPAAAAARVLPQAVAAPPLAAPGPAAQPAPQPPAGGLLSGGSRLHAVPLAARVQNVAAVGEPAARAGGSPARAARPAAGGRDPDHPPAKRATIQPQPPAPVPSPALTAGPAASGAQVGGMTAAGLGAADGAAAPGLAGPPGPAPYLLPPEPAKPFLARIICTESGGPGEAQVQVELQALNHPASQRGGAGALPGLPGGRAGPGAELVCMAGPARRWTDVVAGRVVALAGSSRLVVAATEQGKLLVYSPAGRRLLPPLSLGAPPVHLAVPPGSATLLALTADGRLRVWELGGCGAGGGGGEALCEASVADLVQQPAGGGQRLRVLEARLSGSGRPLVVLSDASAHVHHPGLRAWLQVADGAFPASPLTSGLTTGAGDLSRLQAAVAGRRQPGEVLSAAEALAAARPAAAARAEAAQLEGAMAAAEALGSGAEWRLWLITYVRRLAADEDEGRLRELMYELMGPLRWAPATHAAGAAGPAGAAAPSGPSRPCPGWQPSALGHDKRRLLREAVVREVAKNRALQGLVAEVLDQLKALDAGPGPMPGAAQGPGEVDGAGGAAGRGPRGSPGRQHPSAMALG